MSGSYRQSDRVTNSGHALKALEKFRHINVGMNQGSPKTSIFTKALVKRHLGRLVVSLKTVISKSWSSQKFVKGNQVFRPCEVPRSCLPFPCLGNLCPLEISDSLFTDPSIPNLHVYFGRELWIWASVLCWVRAASGPFFGEQFICT